MKRAAHVALVLPDLRFGGGQRVMLELARRFVAAGVRVDLINLAGDGELVGDVPPGVRYLPVAPGSSGLRLAVVSVAWLRRYLRQAKPDAILSTMTGANVATLVAAKLARFRGSCVVREAASTLNASAFRRFLMRWVYRCASKVVTVSQGVADDLSALGIHRVNMVAIPNPIDVDRVRSLAAEPAELPVRPYIVAVGRLTIQKDHATLLRAYAVSEVRATHSLAIVGEGPERPALESLIASLGLGHDVILAGSLVNPYPWVRGASLMVLSSRWEGYPNVLLEAFALDVPVVSTDCPAGPAELLKGGAHGRLVAVADIEALARAMSSELAARSGGYAAVVNEHLPDIVAGRYLEVLSIAGHAPC